MYRRALGSTRPPPPKAHDMEGIVKGCGTEAVVLTRDSVGRGEGQVMATVITLIFAGQLCRCRMTVSRPPSWPRTHGVGRDHNGPARVLGNSVRPTHDRRSHTRGHAALATSGTTWPTAHTKPANARATAIMALGGPSRAHRWR
jgi:hypothetical protein